MQARAVDRPIFIVGCGRSGTTLLFQLLRRHPRLAPTTGYPDGEDHVGWNKHGSCWISGLGYPDRDRGHTGYHYCLHMSERDVTPVEAEAMTAYYRDEVLREHAGARVVNKCPHLSNKLRYVRAIFTDAKFVHIIRDCLPVVASWMELMKEQAGQVLYWPEGDYPCLWVMPAPEGQDRGQVFRSEKRMFPGGGTVCLVDYWRTVNRNIPLQLLDTPRQLLTVRYEDLCAAPRKTLNKILDFCELEPFEISIEDDYGRGVGSRNDKALSQFSDEQAEGFLKRADDTRQLFGYS